MKAKLMYCVEFGRNDYSDPEEWEVELTPEEAKIYRKVIKNDLDFDDFPELEAVKERAIKEIEKAEQENMEILSEESGYDEDEDGDMYDSCSVNVWFA